MIICELCFKAILYCVRINGYFVCEECVDKAKERPEKDAAPKAETDEETDE